MSSKYFLNGHEKPFDSIEEALELVRIKKAMPYVDRILAKGSHEHKAKILLGILPTLQKELAEAEADVKKYIREYIEI